ncbi:SIR2 family protein [Deinococcus sp. YIM 134068]|uniref:SIR2 family protein n=1 Tax=Deinococcus lichenicola TaxID=3118910 RepID=UPI002F9421D8
MSVTLDGFAKLYSQRQVNVQKCIYSESPGLFIGAGLDYGLSPLWSDLIKELLVACHATLPTGSLNCPQQARVAKEANETEYKRIILDRFKDWDNLIQKAVTKLHLLPLSTVVTTNYTGAIRDALSHQYFSVKALPDINEHDLAGNPKTIFHIHGLLEGATAASFCVILSEDEYEQYYGPTGTVENFLMAYFKGRNVVFMGFSFDDPFIYTILLKIKELEDKYSKSSSGAFNKPSRYALMGLDFSEVKTKGSKKTILDVSYVQQIEERLENIGVVPVWYDSSDKHHRLSTLIDEWFREANKNNPTIEEERITYDG